MGRYEDWVKHEIDHLERMADNADLPLWLRLHYLAMSRMRSDGHAHFERGEVARLMGKVNKEGELIPADRRAIQRGMKMAKERGVLSDESGTTCLVVPRNVAWKGKFKHIESTCTRHKARSNVRHSAWSLEGECTSLSDDNVRHSVMTSARRENGKPPVPLESSLPATWTPTPEHEAQAKAKDFPLNLDALAHRFREWHAARPHVRRKDWDAEFTTWLDREQDTRPEWKKQADAREAAAQREADHLWSFLRDQQQPSQQQADDREPVPLGSLLDVLPPQARKEVEAIRRRRRWLQQQQQRTA